MFNPTRTFALSFLFVSCVKCTVVSSPSVEHTFRQCLLSTPVGTGSMGQCLGMGVLNKLQSWDNEPEFDLVDGVSLTRDPKEYREAYSFAESDPSSFRSIVDSISQVFSQRQMRWDMSPIYPGLIMHITPSPGTAGYLEFTLDPHKQAANRHRLQEASTAKLLLTKNLIVPLLLGFKLKVVTLLPLIFGFLALIAKKALVLSKLSLIISTALGLGTILLGSNHGNYHDPAVGPQVFNQHYAPPYHVNRYPEHYYADDSAYRSNNFGNGIDNNEASPNDQIKLPENLQEIFSTGIGKSDRESRRNFAWNEEEKLKKTT